MTHRYTLLVGGTILSGPEGRLVTAIAWAEGVVLALGTDEQVVAATRGDSHLIHLHGAFVVPAGAVDAPQWPGSATLEVGGPADLDVYSVDPREALAGAGSRRAIARIRRGRLVGGSLQSPVEHDPPDS